MNPVIIKVGLISFFADLSSELLYPITPIFLTQVLHASMTSLGLIEGCAELTASLLKGWAGRKSDEMGRRREFVWMGYLISTLSKASIGLASSWFGVLVARSLDRVGKGVRTAPRDALIAESVPREQLGLAFGIHRGMDTLGAVFGPLLALYLLKIWGEGSLRQFYFLSIIPGLFAVGLAFRLPETIKRVKGAAQKVRRASLSKLPRSYFLFMLGWGVFSITNSSDAFLLLRARSNGSTMTSTVLMYCLFNLVYALLSPIFGKLSDRIGKPLMLKFSLVAFAMVYFGFAYSISPWLLFPVYGIFMAMSEGIGKALIAEFVPAGKESELGATAQGFFGMVTGFSALGASLAAGLLWDHISPTAPFIYGGFGAILSLIVFLFLK
jgi:MFS family permease